MDGIYNSGLNREDWGRLKDAVLDASYTKIGSECISYIALPPHLRQHEIGQLVGKSLSYGDKDLLDDAAKKLVGGAAQAWLVLMKS